MRNLHCNRRDCWLTQVQVQKVVEVVQQAAQQAGHAEQVAREAAGAARCFTPSPLRASSSPRAAEETEQCWTCACCSNVNEMLTRSQYLSIFINIQRP